ncbi:hypothetical protein HMPREF9075_00115 [Capnocytophaga sp. oral taxon 332 str. F0381]|nr:hypothetical protein HMPREF9075_00115 [Capnocytophaga sp. oral taxon 332 str. F0381]
MRAAQAVLSFAQPSLILRLSFAQPSLRRIMNFELIGVRAAQEIRSVSSHYVFGVR